MRKYRRTWNYVSSNHGQRWNLIMICMIVPILVVTLLVYVNIESMLVSILQAEGANMIHQLSSATVMYSGQFEAELRRVGSLEQIQSFVNFPSGAYYEMLRPENAVDNDLVRNYQYCLLKSQVISDLTNIKDMSTFIRSVSLVDSRKNLMLYQSGSQNLLSETLEFRDSFSTYYKYETYVVGPTLTNNSTLRPQASLKLIYNVGANASMVVDVDYSAILNSLILQMPVGQNALLAVLNDEGAVCWSTDVIADNQRALIDSRPQDGTDVFWSNDGQLLGVRYYMPALNSEFVGIFERSVLFDRISEITTVLLFLLGGLLIYFLVTMLVSSRFFNRQLRNIRSYLSGESTSPSRLIDLEDIYSTIDAMNDSHRGLVKRLSDSLPIHRQQFVSAWLTGSLQPEDLDASLKYFEIDLHGMYLIAFSSDRAPQFSELCMNDLDDALRSLAGRHRFFHTRLPSNQLVVIVEWSENGLREVRDLAQKLTVKLEEMNGMYYHAGISHWAGEFCDLRRAAREADAALRFRGVSSADQVVCADDISRSVSTIWVKEEKKRQLCEAIGAGNIEETIHSFDSLCDEGGDNVTLNDAVNHFLWIYGAAMETLARCGADEAPYIDLVRLLNTPSYHSLRIAFRQFVCEAAEMMHDTLLDRSGHYLESLDDIISDLPVDQLSLEYIAQVMDVSPSHLSHSFREYTGQRFIDYLTNLRLKRAEELLANTSMLVQDVAVAVGWSKVSYFTSLFKQFTGMSPTEFRKSKRRPNIVPDDMAE